MTLTGLRVVIKNQGLRMCRCSSSYKTENQGKRCHEYQKQNSWMNLKQLADCLTESVIYNKGKYIAFYTPMFCVLCLVTSRSLVHCNQRIRKPRQYVFPLLPPTFDRICVFSDERPSSLPPCCRIWVCCIPYVYLWTKLRLEERVMMQIPSCWCVIWRFRLVRSS
jgi:hypothetical protein